MAVTDLINQIINIYQSSGATPESIAQLRKELIKLNEDQLNQKLAEALSNSENLTSTDEFSHTEIEEQDEIMKGEKTVTVAENGDEITEIRNGEELLQRIIKHTEESGKVVETVIFYAGGKPLFKQKKEDGNTVESSMYETEQNEDGEEFIIISSTQKSVRIKQKTRVKSVDENGDYTDEDFISRDTESLLTGERTSVTKESNGYIYEAKYNSNNEILTRIKYDASKVSEFDRGNAPVLKEIPNNGLIEFTLGGFSSDVDNGNVYEQLSNIQAYMYALTNGETAQLNYNPRELKAYFESLSDEEKENITINDNSTYLTSGNGAVRLTDKSNKIYKIHFSTENGYTTSYVFDKNGRFLYELVTADDKPDLMQQIYTDGTRQILEYDKDTRKLSDAQAVNPKGQVTSMTHFNYDDNGGLESVSTVYSDITDDPMKKGKLVVNTADGNIFTYSRDENGEFKVLEEASIADSVPILDKNHQVVGYIPVSRTVLNEKGYVKYSQPYTLGNIKDGLNAQESADLHEYYNEIIATASSSLVTKYEVLINILQAGIDNENFLDASFWVELTPLLKALGMTKEQYKAEMEKERDKAAELANCTSMEDFQKKWYEMTYSHFGPDELKNFHVLNQSIKRLNTDMQAIYEDYKKNNDLSPTSNARIAFTLLCGRWDENEFQNFIKEADESKKENNGIPNFMATEVGGSQYCELALSCLKKVQKEKDAADFTREEYNALSLFETSLDIGSMVLEFGWIGKLIGKGAKIFKGFNLGNKTRKALPVIDVIAEQAATKYPKAAKWAKNTFNFVENTAERGVMGGLTFGTYDVAHLNAGYWTHGELATFDEGWDSFKKGFGTGAMAAVLTSVITEPIIKHFYKCTDAQAAAEVERMCEKAAKKGKAVTAEERFVMFQQVKNAPQWSTAPLLKAGSFALEVGTFTFASSTMNLLCKKEIKDVLKNQLHYTDEQLKDMEMIDLMKGMLRVYGEDPENKSAMGVVFDYATKEYKNQFIGLGQMKLVETVIGMMMSKGKMPIEGGKRAKELKFVPDKKGGWYIEGDANKRSISTEEMNFYTNRAVALDYVEDVFNKRFEKEKGRPISGKEFSDMLQGKKGKASEYENLQSYADKMMIDIKDGKYEITMANGEKVEVQDISQVYDIYSMSQQLEYLMESGADVKVELENGKYKINIDGETRVAETVIDAMEICLEESAITEMAKQMGIPKEMLKMMMDKDSSPSRAAEEAKDEAPQGQREPSVVETPETPTFMSARPSGVKEGSKEGISDDWIEPPVPEVLQPNGESADIRDDAAQDKTKQRTGRTIGMDEIKNLSPETQFIIYQLEQTNPGLVSKLFDYGKDETASSYNKPLSDEDIENILSYMDESPELIKNLMEHGLSILTYSRFDNYKSLENLIDFAKKDPELASYLVHVEGVDSPHFDVEYNELNSIIDVLKKTSPENRDFAKRLLTETTKDKNGEEQFRFGPNSIIKLLNPNNPDIEYQKMLIDLKDESGSFRFDGSNIMFITNTHAIYPELTDYILEMESTTDGERTKTFNNDNIRRFVEQFTKISNEDINKYTLPFLKRISNMINAPRGILLSSIITKRNKYIKDNNIDVLNLYDSMILEQYSDGEYKYNKDMINYLINEQFPETPEDSSNQNLRSSGTTPSESSSKEAIDNISQYLHDEGISIRKTHFKKDDYEQDTYYVERKIFTGSEYAKSEFIKFDKNGNRKSGHEDIKKADERVFDDIQNENGTTSVLHRGDWRITIREEKDADGKLIRKTYVVPSKDVPGKYEQYICEPTEIGRNKTQIGFAQKLPNGEILIDRTIQTEDRVVRQLYSEKPNGDRMVISEVCDNNNNVLFSHTFEFSEVGSDGNHFKSIEDGIEYNIEYLNDKVVVTREDGETAEVSIGGNNLTDSGVLSQDLLPLIKKLPGSAFFEISKHGLKKIGKNINDVEANNAHYDTSGIIAMSNELADNGDLFGLLHEFGHFRDGMFDICKNQEVLDTYEAEGQELARNNPKVYNLLMDYFMDLNHINEGGAITEIIAEVNAFLYSNNHDINIEDRGFYLIEYFPKTFAKVAEQLLSGGKTAPTPEKTTSAVEIPDTPTFVDSKLNEEKPVVDRLTEKNIQDLRAMGREIYIMPDGVVIMVHENGYNEQIGIIEKFEDKAIKTTDEVQPEEQISEKEYTDADIDKMKAEGKNVYLLMGSDIVVMENENGVTTIIGKRVNVQKAYTPTVSEEIGQQFQDKINSIIDSGFEGIEILKDFTKEEIEHLKEQIEKDDFTSFILFATGNKPAVFLTDIDNASKFANDNCDVIIRNTESRKQTDIIVLNKSQVKEIISKNKELFAKRLGLSEDSSVDSIYEFLISDNSPITTDKTDNGLCDDVIGLMLGYPQMSIFIYTLEQRADNISYQDRYKTDLTDYKKALKDYLYSDSSVYKDMSDEFKSKLAEAIDNMDEITSSHMIYGLTPNGEPIGYQYMQFGEEPTETTRIKTAINNFLEGNHDFNKPLSGETPADVVKDSARPEGANDGATDVADAGAPQHPQQYSPQPPKTENIIDISKERILRDLGEDSANNIEIALDVLAGDLPDLIESTEFKSMMNSLIKLEKENNIQYKKDASVADIIWTLVSIQDNAGENFKTLFNIINAQIKADSSIDNIIKFVENLNTQNQEIYDKLPQLEPIMAKLQNVCPVSDPEFINMANLLSQHSEDIQTQLLNKPDILRIYNFFNSVISEPAVRMMLKDDITLSGEERDAIITYKENHRNIIGNEDSQEGKVIAQFLDKQMTEEPLTLYRGEGYGFVDIIKIGDKTLGDILRENENATDSELDELSAQLQGFILQQPQFMSTSMSEYVASQNHHGSKIVWTFELEENSKAVCMDILVSDTKHSDEAEVLVQKNANIEILSISRRNGVYQIKARVNTKNISDELKKDSQDPTVSTPETPTFMSAKPEDKTFRQSDVDQMRSRGERITVKDDGTVLKFDPITKKTVEIGRIKE